MIEILLSAVLYPVARKLGDKWLDRVAEGVDNLTLELLQNAVHAKPGAQQSLENHLKTHPDQAKQLEDRVVSTITSDESIAGMAATTLPHKGAKLQYYDAVLNWLFKQSEKLGRDIALKGFLNDPAALTLIGVRQGAASRTQVIGNQEIQLGWTAVVHVFHGADEMQLEDLFVTTNDELKMSRAGRLARDVEEKFYKVDKIFENWVHYDKLKQGDFTPTGDGLLNLTRYMPEDYTDLSSEIRERVRIRSYDGIKAMIASVLRLAKEVNDDVVELERAIRSALPTKL